MCCQKGYLQVRLYAMIHTQHTHLSLMGLNRVSSYTRVFLPRGGGPRHIGGVAAATLADLTPPPGRPHFSKSSPAVERICPYLAVSGYSRMDIASYSQL